MNFQYPQVFKISKLLKDTDLFNQSIISIIINYSSQICLSVGCPLLILWCQIAVRRSNANWAFSEKKSHIAFIIHCHTAVLSTSMGDPSTNNTNIGGYGKSSIHGKCGMRWVLWVCRRFRMLPGWIKTATGSILRKKRRLP